jgi:hypothetical protein
VREESHLDDMRAAIRGDFERLQERRGEQELMRPVREPEAREPVETLEVDEPRELPDEGPVEVVDEPSLEPEEELQEGGGRTSQQTVASQPGADLPDAEPAPEPSDELVEPSLQQTVPSDSGSLGESEGEGDGEGDAEERPRSWLDRLLGR